MNNQNNFDVRNRVVIVTGGAGLLGREYSRALAQAGAKVVVADMNEQIAKFVSSSINEDSSVQGSAISIKADISNPQSVKNLIKSTLDEFGRIDGLVNNAAIDPKFDSSKANQHTLTFENYPVELWNQSLSVNLTGMFLCSQAVAPVMLQQERGVIVNISSIYGIVGPDQRLYERDDPTAPPKFKPIDYSVTKSAVLGFTKYLASYWSGRGIRVNTLTLGGVYNDHDAEFVRRYSERVPLRRMANKDEYCSSLLFLLSDASSYMTGSNLIVDGGWTAW
ncbi:MAG TPA: SDR family oxidoreductase [Blastocatellia bacterium]|nr:SDR family oxidoreductase [Blastocatellia bacterium]